MIPIEFWVPPLFSNQDEPYLRVLAFGLVLAFVSIFAYIITLFEHRILRALVHAQAVLLGLVIMWPGEYYLSNWQYWERTMIILLFLGGLLFWALSISIFISIWVSRKCSKISRRKATLGLLGAFIIGICTKHLLALITWML